MGLIDNAHFLEQAATRKAAQQQAQKAGDTAALLSQLLWEQQQTNKMLWVTLTDEQRAAFQALR